MFLNLLHARTTWFACFGLFFAACGGEADEVTTGSAGVAPAPTDASQPDSASPADIAEANMTLLQPADDVRDFEVLDVTDGSIASLRSAVDGDRPVLLWFWAPH